MNLETLFQVPFAHHTYSARNGSIHYATLGKEGAPAVVFFHGANMGIGQWYANVKELADSYRLYLVDMYNAGDSSDLPLAMLSPKIYEEAARGFIESEVREEPFAVLGHSFGGWLAARVGMSFPKRCKAMLLIDPAGLCNRIPAKQLLLRLPVISDLLLKGPLSPTHEHVEQFIREGFMPSYTADPTLVSYILEHWETAPIERNPFACARMIVQHLRYLNIEDDIGRTDIPTLIAAGKGDPMADIPRLETYANAHPALKVMIFQKAAHVPSLEEATLFNATILGFLKTTLS